MVKAVRRSVWLASHSSEMSVTTYKTTQCHDLEGKCLNVQNLRYHKYFREV
jgi:hypothetical protein